MEKVQVKVLTQNGDQSIQGTAKICVAGAGKVVGHEFREVCGGEWKGRGGVSQSRENLKVIEKTLVLGKVGVINRVLGREITRHD